MNPDTAGEDCIIESNNPKKRQSYGRMKDVTKRLRAQSFELGEKCLCKRFKCFDVIKEEEQKRIINNFNEIGATSKEPWNAQASYLSGLMTVLPVARRRSRAVDKDPKYHDCNFSYRVRINSELGTTDVQVCKKAFIALHGLTKRRLDTIQQSLKSVGVSPRDKRGLHKNRPHKLTPHQLESVCNHIKSFKGRLSHYSNEKTKRLYLPEELSIKQMHRMYKEKCKETNNLRGIVSGESYRTILNTRFNVAFGYPRSDTCSTCDINKTKTKELETAINSLLNGKEKDAASAELKKIEIQQKVHLKKANTFYSRKRDVRKFCTQKSNCTEAICMDFQRNLNIPNITTNDAYYRRKLSFYMFNIHSLPTKNSLFYCYTEVIGGKGCNEVVSFLDHYVTQCLDNSIRNLSIFCDSCGGQNKNYTVFKYLYYLVHVRKRFTSVQVTFPVRGHSYMESDKNMGIIQTKTPAEIPQHWIDVVETSRTSPFPFKAIEVDQGLIRNWSEFLNHGGFIKKCPFQIRPIKEINITDHEPTKILHRDSYNGHWTSSTITLDLESTEIDQPQGQFEFILPPRAYESK